MRHTVKVLSYLLISSIVTSLVFAGDKKTEEELLKNKLMDKMANNGQLKQAEVAADSEQEENVLNIRATSKPYNGFLGTIVTPAQKQYPEGAEGDVLELLDNWDNIPPEDIAMTQVKLTTILSSMSYEELRNIYEYNANPQVESALYQSWLTTQRSGQPGIGLSRSTGAESEPNNNKSSADAVSADTTLGYLTAYDEDWYSITVNSASDWVFKTHASSANDNVGDTKLYLYADTSSTNSIASDVTSGYSTINHRFNSVAAIPQDLFISEYAEGSSYNKYMEIYNGTGAAVDLSNYRIMQNSNGGPWDESVDALSGTLADGDVYVIANSSASSSILAHADLTGSGICYFNGDDARALIKVVGSDTTILDYIGTFPDDPGSGWAVAGVTNATKDHTLVRKSSVRSGNTNWASSAGTNATDSEWEVTNKPTATYTSPTLGSHTIPNLNQFFIKVAGYSGTYAGAYLLTVTETAFNANNGTVVINEINYNPGTTNDSTEFVELYNSGASAVDMSGWDFSGILPGDFTIPAGASIAASGYYVIARDSARYVNLYGSEANLYWGYTASYSTGSYWTGYTYYYFDLSDAGETIELKDSTGALVDEVTYDDVSPWSTGADGGGSTLELLNATTNNNVASSWRGHGKNGGTPGAANSAQPDLSMGASISSYLAVGSSTSGSFQLNNNGDAALSIDSITVDSQYVAGTGTDYSMANATNSGSSAATTATVSGGPSTIGGATLVLTWVGASWTSEASATLTSPTGTVVTVVSTSTSPGTFTIPLTNFNGESSDGTWTLTLNDSYGDGGQGVTGVTLTLETPGVTVDPTVGGLGIPAWLSVTAPTSDIAAGDSGNVTVTFNADSITSAVSYSAAVNVINNDPQDSAKTFTATMNVLPDTAILDISSNTAFNLGVVTLGDTGTVTATISIQNDGGVNLVVDSLRFAVGNNYFSNLTDSTVVEPNATASFKVYTLPQAYGALRDTLVFSINSDSTSGEKVALSAYAYNDTTENHHKAEILTDWTLSSVTKSTSNGWAYMTSNTAASLISPRVAGTSDSVMIRVKNIALSATQKFRLYWGTDKDATFPTANTWTLKDSASLPTGMTISDYFVMNLNVAATDTGYVGIKYDGTYIEGGTYTTYLYDVVVPDNAPIPVVGTPAGYALEPFDSGKPADWSGDLNSSISSGGYDGKYIRGNVYYSDPRDSLITSLVGPMASGDSLVFAYRAIDYGAAGTATTFAAGDGMNVYFKSQDGSTRALLWSIGSTNHTATTSWAKKNVDLTAYAGVKGYFLFDGVDTDAGSSGGPSRDWYACYDEVLYPLPEVPSISLAASSLNLYGVAVDTAAGTGSHSLTTTVSNTGLDTLTGTIASRSTDFTVSPATIDLLPDSSMTLTVTYAPSATGFDSSYVDITSNNGGVANAVDSMRVLGYAFEADNYNHFEFIDYDSSGFVRQNTAGGTYWKDNTSTSTLGGSNSVAVSSHKYGGESWLITPAYTIDADGERLSWHMKTSDATPTTTSKLYIKLLTGNTLADLANAVTLDSFVVSATASDVTEDWLLNFVDAYNLSGTTYHYGFHYVDASSGGSNATGAGFYIDNIYFSDAPNVPILTLGSDVLHSGVTYLDSGFVRTAVAIGQNTGGDTLLISSVTSDDSDMTVSVVADTVLPQGLIALNFSVPDSVLVMGKYTTTLTLVHNDTSFSDGSDTYKIKADFTHTLESFESYGVPAGWKTVDADEDGNGWTFGSSVMSTNGSRAAYSYKATDQTSSENWLISTLYSVGDSTDKLIFNAHYSSAVDPDYMDVMISKNLGDWVELASVSMMGTVNWERYEYALSAYVGSDVRFAIVDRNYGNETMDRLWVDRFLLPAKTAIKPISHYRVRAADGSYVYKDSTALVQGVVTVSDQYGGPGYIQDSSAGLAIYNSDFSNGVEVGDRVSVRGKFIVYAGLLEIAYAGMTFFIESSGNVVTPKMTTLEQLQDPSVAEAHEGMLLKVDRLTWVDPSDWDTGSNFNLDVAQAGPATWVYDANAGTVTLNGAGAYLGLPKTYNGGELGAANADSVIVSRTYGITLSSGNDTMTVSINFGAGYWTYKLVAVQSSSGLSGTWKVSPEAGALMVGPGQNDGSWWSNSAADVTTRACYFDDEYVFNANGSFSNVLGSETWIESWQGVAADQCGTPVAPHDGSNQASVSFDVRIDYSTDLSSLDDPPYGIFDMVAVMGQYHTTSPDSGFNLLPRGVGDIALQAEYHGTVTNVATGAALSGVAVATDISSDTSGASGWYRTSSSLTGSSLSFSKDGYTPATFSINASGAGFTMMDVGLYPSPDSVVYVNGLEVASDSGYVDTSSSATGTQWAVVRSLQAEMYVSYNNYLDTLIQPASGSMMLALNDFDTTNGNAGYENNSYSIWFAPGVVNLAAFTGVTQKTLSMDLWLDSESNYDFVKAMVKSAADTTDTWMILGSNSGNMGGWGSWDINLAPVDTMTDAQFALLFDSDASVIRGFGALVDNIQVHGRDLFVAMGPSNLSASNFVDDVVNLSWSAPGTGGSVGYQFIDIHDVLETPSSPVEDPRFNTNPEPYFKTVEIAPSYMNMASSRSLTHYNVFRKAEGATSYTLYGSASASTSYADAGVTNYMQYHYYVTAVYDEGESGSSNIAMGVPGMVVEAVLPLHEDFHAMSGPLPGDWSTEGADVFDWSTGDAENASGATFTFPYHGEFAYINNDSSTYANPSSPATLVTPFFRHENVVQAAYLKFETYVLQSSTYYGSFEVMVRNSYGPWTTVASLSSTSDGWETVMFDVSEHVVGHNYVQVGFRYQEGYYYYRSGWGIDNVKIGLEPGPDNLMAHGSSGAIQLNWGMPLSSVQDPGGTPVGFDENNRPVYLSAPNCEVCEPVDVNRIPEIRFGASFDYDEPTQFVEYDAVLDSTIDLSSDQPTNWDKNYTDANSSGSFDAGDPGWVNYYWYPTQTDFDQWIISNSFDASGDTSVVLMFDEYLDDYPNSSYPDAHDTAAAHISYDDGVTWTTVWELADEDTSTPFGPEGYWSRHVIPVDGAGTAQMKVAFSFRGGNSYNIDYFHVDNIYVLDEIPQDHYDVFNVYRDGEMLVGDHEYTSFTDADVLYGDEHCYRVQPKHVPYPDGMTVVTGLSNIACAAPGNQIPTVPTLLSPADNDTIMINVDANGNYVDQNNNVAVSFSWEGSTDPDEHELMYYIVVGGEFEMIPVDLGITALLSFEVPYNVLVPAMASIGETVISGNWAIGVTDSIPIYQPVPFEFVVSDERFLVIDAGYALSVDEGLLPEVFALHQNFPNPFNPITTIRYDVPEQSHVMMEIYNVLGQKVAVVVNGIHDPGFHAVRWNGTNMYGNALSSGMYFYHIQAGDFRSIKKLILVK